MPRKRGNDPWVYGKMEVLSHPVRVQESSILSQVTSCIDLPAGHKNIPFVIFGRYLQPHLSDVSERGGEVMTGPDVFDPDLHLNQFAVPIEGGNL